MGKNKKKIVITGGSGLLAMNFAMAKRNEYDIHLFVHTKNITLDDVIINQVNLENSEELERIVRTIRPDYILHTAGLTNVDLCEKNRYKAYLANVLITKNVSIVANELGIKLVHVSTDHFSDSEVEYSTEKEIAIPVNIYAQTKLEAEFEVMRNTTNSLIVRTNFFGWGHKYRTSFTDYIIETLRQNKTVKLFTDVFFTPIGVDDLTDLIIELVEKGAQGIYNVTGNQRISKYDFGIQLAKVFNLDFSYIEPSSIAQRSDLTKRPRDMSLSNNKLKSMVGRDVRSLEQSFIKLREQELQGWHSVLRKTVQRITVDRLNYGRQSIGDEDFESIMLTLSHDFLTQGPMVGEFENKIASYVGVKYAVAVCNLTCGLHIACLAAGVKSQDIVLTSPISFMASSNSAIYAGAIPAFADINLQTLTLDPDCVEKQCQKLGNVRVIMPVHLAGAPCDMESLKRIADDYGAVIIEDAAQALGGKYTTGGKIGNCAYSLMTGFSFHPVKSITTGEGGVITTNDENVYKQLIRLRSHGITKADDKFVIEEQAFTNGIINPWYHEMQQLGFNYRITDFQCALGLSQLNKIDYFMERRREIAHKYDECFKDLRFARLVQSENRSISGNHLYILLVDFDSLRISRAELFMKFRKIGIGLQVHHIPIPIQPYYRNNFDIDLRELKSSMDYYDRAVSFPLFPTMTDDQVDFVIKAVKEILG